MKTIIIIDGEMIRDAILRDASVTVNVDAIIKCEFYNCDVTFSLKVKTIFGVYIGKGSRIFGPSGAEHKDFISLSREIG